MAKVRSWVGLDVHARSVLAEPTRVASGLGVPNGMKVSADGRTVNLLIPLYVVMQKLGLINNLGALVLVETAETLPFSIWLLAGYFRTIPRDIEVQLHDPATALYGGPDGLDVVRQVSPGKQRASVQASDRPGRLSFSKDDRHHSDRQ